MKLNMYDKFRTVGHLVPEKTRKVISKPLANILDKRKEINCLNNYSKFVKEGDLVFDVGANEGQMTDMFLTLGAKVVCIEPQPKLVEFLREKYKDNSNVTIVPKGVASTEGELILNICKEVNTSSSFLDTWHDKDHLKNFVTNPVLVEVTTLDKLITEHGKPSFIKIDVEGFELEVLKGLTTKIDVISFEYTNGSFDVTIKCVEELSQFGGVEFTYFIFPKFKLKNKWLSSQKLISELSSMLKKDYQHGDIFARAD